MGIVCASTFGRISPKSSSRKVTSTVLKRNSKRRKVKTESMIVEVRMTMQTFTRLFTTRIVASSRSTSFNRRSMAPAEAARLFFRRLMSLCDREKKEVSAPDTRAEIHNSRSVTAQNTAMRGSNPLKTIQEPVSSKLTGV